MAAERVQRVQPGWAADNTGNRVAAKLAEAADLVDEAAPARIPAPDFRAAFGALTDRESIHRPTTPRREAAGVALGPKLLVNDPGEAYEREADRIAAHAAGATSPSRPARFDTSARPVPRAVPNGRSRPVDPALATEILRARGGGRTLSPSVRQTMERAFGTDFGAVRIHTDARADVLNRSLSASAFTIGHDLFFRAAAYDPGTPPGRELLAHELAHTMQQQRAVLSPAPAIQRRLVVSDSSIARPKDADRSVFNADERRELIARKIKRALDRQQDQLGQFDVPTEIELVLKSDLLLTWIKELLASPIDYGSIDVADVNQLALLYFQIKLRAKPVTDKGRDSERARKETETTAKDQSSKAIHDWIEYRDNVVATAHGAAPEEVRKRVFKLALLGRGASIAFYLDTNQSKLDQAATVLIGLEQPWRKKRGAKGAANQPMLMVGPRSTQRRDPYSGGLAGRQDLSDAIDRVIALHIIEKNNVNAKIDSVTKKTGPQDAGHVKYYEIETSKGTFYAQNVVVGFGIGSHKKPDEWSPELETANTTDTNKFNNFPRVIDLDTFQEAVAADKLLPNPINGEEPLRKLIVVGPNAAIDALTTALRYEYPEIIWVTKSDGSPIFLPGTDNAHVKDTYEQVLASRDPDVRGAEHMKYSRTFGNVKVTVIKHDYLGVSISGDGVTVNYGNRRPKKEKVGSVDGQIMVYGLGPDVEPIKQIFGDSTGDALKNRLRPVYDINRSFNYSAIEPKHLTAVVGDLNEPVARILDNVSRVREVKQIHDDRRAAQPLPEILPSVIGLSASTNDPSDPTSLEFIGGTAYRLAEEVKYSYISEAIDKLEYVDLNAIETALHQARQGDDVLDAYAASFFAPMRIWLTEARRIAADIEKGEPGSVGTTNEPIDDLAKKLDAVATRPISRRLRAIAAQSSSKELIAASGALSDAIARAAAIPLQLGELAQESRAVLATNQRAQPSKASEHMKAVPFSLPKNIALNDQLTPSRSEVEAASAYIPSSVAQTADFISSDHRIIAVHIAQKYQHLPPLLADYVTARIVYERRHLDEASAPLPQQVPGSDPKMGKFNLDKLRTFQAGWVDKLAKLDKLFEEKKQRAV